MKETLETLAQIIIIDIFIGYGLYSVVFVAFTSIVKRSEFLNKLDGSANTIIILSGLLYLISFVILLYLSLPVMAFGPYWWAPWSQPIIWILVTQLLWIKKLRHSKMARLIISFLLIVSFERYVIMVTSFHRDYIPGGWASALTTSEIIIGLTLKTAIFSAMAMVCLYVTDSIKKLKTKENEY